MGKDDFILGWSYFCRGYLVMEGGFGSGVIVVCKYIFSFNFFMIMVWIEEE